VHSGARRDLPRRRAAARLAASALLALLLALATTGCGKATPPSAAQLALEREDLVVVCRALQSLEGQSESEVNATRAAWPQIYRGPARRDTGLYTTAIREAVESAERVELPTLLEERDAASLTGPAYGLASLYREFAGLANRGWAMIGESIYQIEHGTPSAARFARENIALYIDAVYDAHFGLGQIGHQLLAAYSKLGGEAVFGVALTQPEANAIAAAYSQERERLEPHVAVKLGS
jgi:hypothetical protein